MLVLLNIEKKQRKNAEDLAEDKCKNIEALNNQLKEYNKGLEKDKVKLEEEIQKYALALDSIKDEFKNHEKKV